MQIQVDPLSQAIRTAACLSWGQNITVKSVHLTSLYILRRWRRKMIIWVFYVTICLYLMQNYAAFRAYLGVNFGVIWRFELFSLSGFFLYLSFHFLLRKSGLIFRSPMATLLPTWQRAPQLQAYAACNACRAMLLFIRLNPRSCEASKHLT